MEKNVSLLKGLEKFAKQHQLLATFFSLSLLMVVVSAIILAINIKDFPSPVIIHFDVFNRVDSLGTIKDVWRLWSLGPLFLLMNTALTVFLIPKEKNIPYLLLGASLLTSLVMLAFVAVLTKIN